MSDISQAVAEPAGLLTMADLAARFSIPESTARYYCKRFNAFLPQAGQGRRRYKPEAVQVFAAVLEAMRRTRHAQSVEMELSLHYPALVAAEAAEQPALRGETPRPPAAALQEFGQGLLQALNAQARALERIAEVLGSGAFGGKEGTASTQAFPAQGRAAENVAGEIESLRKEVKTLRGLLSSSEEIHQQDLEQMRKWLNRLGASQDSGGKA